MDQLLATKSLPPGFRFHPTDEELFMYYLKRKAMGKSLHPQMISDVDVYRFAPWDLPDKSWLKTRDLNWYFFCPRSQKYSQGGRTNRSTEFGYWKSTGNDRSIEYKDRPVGKIKTLIFHRGKPPKGERTDWVMHEYRLDDKVLADKGVHQDAYVISKVYKKSGLGPKNGEDYGAPFVEEEWETCDDDNLMKNGVLGMDHVGCVQGEDQSASVITNFTNALHVPDFATASTVSVEEHQQGTPAFETQNAAATPTPSVMLPAPVEEFEVDPIEMEQDEIDRLLAMLRDNDTQIDAPKEVPDNDIFNRLGDLAANRTHTIQRGFDWSQFIADNRDDYIEVGDLNKILQD